MTVTEVILIIAGFACICISFFVSKKKSAESGEYSEEARSADVWSDRDEEVVREHIDTMLRNCQADVLDETKDEMNRICNEKIMAVDEFSGQVLEKIESNHKEVVFMYNMLNEKDKEIKKIMAEPVKTGVQNVQKSQEPEAETARPVKPAKPAKPEPAVQHVSARPAAVPEQAPVPKPAVIQMKEKKEKKAQTPVRKRAAAVPERVKTPAPKEPLPGLVAAGPAQKTNVPGNVNLQIQKMYKEGKTVLEISRELNIGQGEVKLVIALYGGNKK